MEAGAVGAPVGTGSKTMADLLPLAASEYAGAVALRHKVGDDLVEVSYEELGRHVRELALGLVDLGIAPGDKVAILAHTRPEWTYACFGILCAGAVSVSIYQTNSAEECEYVLDHSEAGAVFVEDAEQLAKVRQVESRLPHLRHVIVMEPGEELGAAIPLEELRERGRAREGAELDARVEAVAPEDVCLMMYTSGTTGPPKGCLLTNRNYRAIVSAVEHQAVLEDDDCVYLFLPLAHAFALLIQFAAVDLGAAIAYWEKDPQRIVANLIELRPTYFPSVPRMFEKIYALATAAQPDAAALRRAVEVGLDVRARLAAGDEVPEGLQAAFDAAEESLYRNVRALFGGRVRQANTGAAPIATEILEFFYACGVPVMEGYGMTETATVATVNTLDAFRWGSVGRPLPGVAVRTAPDGELLIRGPNIFTGYYKNREATEESLEGDWLHTGDLGRIDDGFVHVTGRKKDVIITAGGKNVAPANLENHLKQSPLISQAVVVGDRRPYLIALITLDAEEAPKLAQEHGIEPERLHESEPVVALVQPAIDELNGHVGPVEQIKRFAILPRDLSQDAGELTPTLKVKRNVVCERYEDVVESVYARER